MEKLGVLKLYPPKNKFEKKDGFQYAPMHMIFDLKQKDLQHKARILVGVNVVNSIEYTTY